MQKNKQKSQISFVFLLIFLRIFLWFFLSPSNHHPLGESKLVLRVAKRSISLIMMKKSKFYLLFRIVKWELLCVYEIDRLISVLIHPSIIIMEIFSAKMLDDRELWISSRKNNINIKLRGFFLVVHIEILRLNNNSNSERDFVVVRHCCFLHFREFSKWDKFSLQKIFQRTVKMRLSKVFLISSSSRKSFN